MIINTSEGQQAIEDSASIRRTALRRRFFVLPQCLEHLHWCSDEKNGVIILTRDKLIFSLAIRMITNPCCSR